MEDPQMNDMMLVELMKHNGVQYYYDIAWQVYKQSREQTIPTFVLPDQIPQMVKEYLQFRKEKEAQRSLGI